ncbi:uncharacterized protein V1516DRAFT_100484 [Lipomyces oligophaga]|uniref:uncharacterized protein n=1 Tax=Lipomyces oligophaga TaxID=45792 RepID=UPI0034CEC6F0
MVSVSESPSNSTPLQTRTSDALPRALLKTGLCYDMRMRYHAKIINNAHDYLDPHPEDPRRVYRIYKALADAGLVGLAGATGAMHISSMVMQHIPAREAEKEEVTLVHDEKHWAFIERTTHMVEAELKSHTNEGDSVYFNNFSFFCARLSCGGVIDTCKAVVEGKVKNAIAVVRPPGHHAEPTKPAGFCMFNNVSVASRVILKTYPDQIKKIMILDWDIHHGNGTQRAFYDDPNVLYISLHRYENARFYPGSDFANYDKCGVGAGEGRSVNIPWPCAGMADGDYIYAFQRVVMPIANEFNPDLVILSSGFDAAPGDELGGCFVSPAAYGHMTHMLKSLASGKLAVVLEGGYNLDSIAISALAVTKVLIGEAPMPLKNVYARPESVETVQKVMNKHAQYWKCMAIGHKIRDLPDAPAVERLHDVIRKYQATNLFSMCQMTSLPIFRDRISRSFEDQVLCTPNFQKSKTLFVIVHDPPEIWTEPDPVTGEISLHETFVKDPLLMYTAWATKKNYGVVDINIPELYTDQEDEDYNAQAAMQDLAVYVWDNFLELSDAKDIVFISVGSAAAAVVYLLGHREVRERVRGSVTFLGSKPVVPIIPAGDDYIIDWYHKCSMVLTFQNHSMWTEGKNPRRKKYGGLQKTEYNDMYELMVKKFDSVLQFLGLSEGESPEEDEDPSAAGTYNGADEDVGSGSRPRKRARTASENGSE